MPYSYPNDVPDYIKNLPVGAQKIFISVFNSTLKDGDSEDKARQAGWGAIKQKYKKVNGKWVKKNINKMEHIMKKTFKVEEITNQTNDKGFFKSFIPLIEVEGSFVVEKTVNDVKKKYLVGEASNTNVDKGDDRMAKSFIEKMANSIVGLNVFAEHEHSFDKTVGYISDAYVKGDSLIVETSLEDEEDNSIVKSILKKINHGTKIFYSVAGRITKAVKRFDEEIEKTVRELMDGEIYETSLTALPEGNVSFIQPIMKSMDNLLKSINENGELENQNNDSENIPETVENVTKALQEMLQSSNLEEQIYDLFYAFRGAIYKVTNDEDLTPAEKKTRILSLADEYSEQVEILSGQLADLAEQIENDLS